MRIKFSKGMTPEQIADLFLKFIYDNKMIIGTVNMYIQSYDDEIKPEKFNNSEYYQCSPNKKAKEEYDKYVVAMRRNRLRAVSNK